MKNSSRTKSNKKNKKIKIIENLNQESIVLNGNYNIDFSPFLIDLKCKIYKRKNNLTLDKISR